MYTSLNGLRKLRIFYISEYWLNPNKVKDTNYASLNKLYKEKLAKLYTDNWMNELQMSSKCSLYRNFKIELTMEKYLCVLANPICLD